MNINLAMRNNKYLEWENKSQWTINFKNQFILQFLKLKNRMFLLINSLTHLSNI